MGKKIVVELDKTLVYDEDHEKDWNNAFRMGNLNEAGLLSLLKLRIQDDKIYTWIGDVLLSVNPYHDINFLYEPIPTSAELKSMERTANPHLYVLADRAYHSIFDVSVRRKSQSILISGESGAGKTEAAKHAVAYLANLSSEKRKQLAAKAGSSAAARLGAKKANVNIFAKKKKVGGPPVAVRQPSMRQPSLLLAKSTRMKSTRLDEEAFRPVTNLEKVIVETNTLIEVFGNAVTLRNDNSSRFGKFVQLEYDNDGVICGAQTKHFLLERSRIVDQGEGETNYHIFYMLAAAFRMDPESQMFEYIKDHFDPKESYRYLNDVYDPYHQPKPMKKIETEEDMLNEDDPEEVEQFVLAEKFWDTCRSLSNINTNAEEQQDMWRVVACILALGNIEFDEDHDGCYVTTRSAKALKDSAWLLGVEKQVLELGLCKRTVRAARRASFQQVALSKGEASKSRDGLAKAIYEALFEWMVDKVNIGTRNTIRNLSNAKQQKADPLFIGILDIFGFEIFETNSFEQLCINYANESLQNMFDDHVRTLEKSEYEAENIPFRNIEFRDNKKLLKMFNNKGDGIFQLLDEQGALGKRASDQSLLRAINSLHGSNKNPNPFYAGLKKGKDDVFTIIHFAGPVGYSVEGMVAKNSDHLQPDLAELIMGSNDSNDQAKGRRNTFKPLSALIHLPHLTSGGNHAPSGGGSKAKPFTFLQEAMKLREQGGGESAKIDNRQTQLKRQKYNNTSKSVNEENSYAKKMARLITISGRFRSQMKALERILSGTSQHYVRCIKPNALKAEAGGKNAWDPHMVVGQLRMLGALQMVDVRRQGYPVRSAFDSILKQHPKLLQQHEVEWIPGDNDRQACAEMLNKLYPGEKGDAFVMGDNLCFMKESTFTEIEAKERELTGEIVLDDHRADLSKDTYRNFELPGEDYGIGGLKLTPPQAEKEV